MLSLLMIVVIATVSSCSPTCDMRLTSVWSWKRAHWPLPVRQTSPSIWQISLRGGCNKDGEADNMEGGVIERLGKRKALPMSRNDLQKLFHDYVSDDENLSALLEWRKKRLRMVNSESSSNKEATSFQVEERCPTARNASDDILHLVAASSDLVPHCRVNFFPYGDSSFKDIRRNKQYWKDNTKHIASVVEMGSKHQLFLRPPRWGKSLFVDMMDCYLDINANQSFDELFGGTEIYGMKQQLQHNNKYYVMRLDLSIDIGSGDPAIVEARLHDAVYDAVDSFCQRYNLDRHAFRPTNALVTLRAAVSYVENKLDGRVFILIDEYDRFAYKLMLEVPDAYNRVVAGRAGDAFSSPIRALLGTIKSMQRVRTFTVGLSPIALGDASEVNYMDDISDEKAVGDMVGLSEMDVRCALKFIFASDDEIGFVVGLMKRFYNGFYYRGLSVSGVTEPLYHTQLCLYFFKKLCKDSDFRSRVISGTVSLREMIDKNTEVGDNVINLLIRQDEFAGIVCQLTGGESLPANVVSSFKLRELLSERASPDLLVSFMRWHGLITMSSAGPGSYLIPNQVVGDAEGLLENVVSAMTEVQYNVRALINEPTAEKVWELNQNIFGTMDTIFDNDISEKAVVGFVETRLKAKASREGFKVVCEPYTKGRGLLTGRDNLHVSKFERRADLVLVDELTKKILILEYKRLRPGRGKMEPCLSLQQHPAHLCQANNVWKANEELLRYSITESKRFLHGHATTVKDLLGKAEQQVSDYAKDILARPKYANFSLLTGVVIVATTKEDRYDSEIFTTVLGVWLQDKANTLLGTDTNGSFSPRECSSVANTT